MAAPASSTQSVVTALMRPAAGDGVLLFTLASTQNDFAPAGNVASVTNVWVATPAPGGSAITGIYFTAASTVTLVNASATDSITFAHLSSSSLAVNQISCPGGTTATLQPLAVTILNYINGVWKFAS